MSLPEGEATGIVRAMDCQVCVPPNNRQRWLSQLRDGRAVQSSSNG
jgi:hypothetical protein